MMNRFLKNRNQAANTPTQPLETTVTFLQMTERPASHAQLPLNTNVALMHVDDMPLHFYRYVFFQVGYQWHWESRLRLDDEALARKIHAETTDIHVLYLDGSPAGFFEIDRIDPTSTDLAYFGMMGHAHGRGLGRWFLSSAIAACWENGPDRITVNTCTLDHPAALPLYQKMGFKPIRQAPGSVQPLTDQELASFAQRGIL